jgi:RNA recognition motif-containing protein
MASKLYIGGLSYSTTSDGLREYFAQCGQVLSATVITDRFSGQSRGFGFVEMNTAEEAQNAISQLNGRELDGRRITVEISNPQAPRTGGGGGRPGGGGGGRPGGGRPGGGGRESGYAHRPSKPVKW